MPIEQDLSCLALNIYHEARGEPTMGKFAVGHVVMNRVASSKYPNDVCAVVRQGGSQRRYRCQFSWWCDGRSDQINDEGAWTTSRRIAFLVLAGLTEDPTRGAKWYHADYVSPSWRKMFTPSALIGRHIFYVDEVQPRPERRQAVLLNEVTIADISVSQTTAIVAHAAEDMIQTVEARMESLTARDVGEDALALLKAGAERPLAVASLGLVGLGLIRLRRAS